MVPERAHQLPGRAVVLAPEQRRRRHARPQQAVGRSRNDHPGPIDRGIHVVGERRAVGLRPLAGEVVTEVEMGPELAVGHGCKDATGASVAHGVLDHLAGKVPAGDLHGATPRTP